MLEGEFFMTNDTSTIRDERRFTDDEHRDRDKKFNWLPFLILPIMFAAGWGLRGAADDGTDGMQYGVGGGPGATPCVVPDSATLDGDTINGDGMTEDPGAAGTNSL
jgi:hypothetical protein